MHANGLASLDFGQPGPYRAEMQRQLEAAQETHIGGSEVRVQSDNGGRYCTYNGNVYWKDGDGYCSYAADGGGYRSCGGCKFE